MIRAASIPFLATGLILGGCARTLQLDDALTLVPYTLTDSGRIIVDVRLNERGPFAFALDTGASISFVFDDVRAELALDAIPDASATVRGAVASGQFPVVRIDRMQVGSEIWSDAELVVLPGATEATATIAGILGIDFLRRYAVAFSATDRVVRLYRPDRIRDTSYRGWADVPLAPVNIGRSAQPLFFLELELQDNTVPALFDLGGGLNLMNTSAARHLRLTPAHTAEGSVFAGVLERAPVLARLSEDVATGGIRWRNEEFLIADTQIFATLLYADRPLAIVGAGMFSQRDFVIDFARNRLLVRTAMSERDASAPQR